MTSRCRGAVASCCLALVVNIGTHSRAADYYVSSSGNDSTGNGSFGNPWATIAKINTVDLEPGDRVLFAGTNTFSGGLDITAGDSGTAGSPVVITSYGGGRAIIAPPTNSHGVSVYNAAGIELRDLVVDGSDSDLHEKNGIQVYMDLPGDDTRLEHIVIADCEVRNCCYGMSIGAWGWSDDPYTEYFSGYSNVTIEACVVHDCRRDGITTWGMYPGSSTEQSHRNLAIRDCVVHNCRGDPNKADGHSGSGIIMSGTVGGVIERCVAYANGDLCKTVGGPVGIWSWGAADVTIQLCEAYSNGAENCDGGGFDIDGGCHNCVIQHCYSHDNDGAGYLICQFSGAPSYVSNTVRYCVSENDGRRLNFGGIHFYSAGSSGGIQDTRIYGNTIFASTRPAVRFQNTGGQGRTRLWNNIFVTTNGEALVNGNPSTNVAWFQNNAYFASGGAFNTAGYASLSAWRSATGQETLDGRPAGFGCDPLLAGPGNGGTIGVATQLHTLAAYKLRGRSPLIDRGLDLQVRFGVDVGTNDFYGTTLPQCRTYDVGAHESVDADGDRLPDDWETFYFGNTNAADGASNGDTDTASDRDEFEAGTDPTNAASCLAIADLDIMPATNAVISWTSTAGRRYAVYSGTNFTGGMTNEVAGGIIATPPLNVQTCAVDLAPTGFFRIVVERE